MSRAGWAKLAVALAVLTAIVVSVAVLGVPSRAQLRSDFTGLGVWAPVLFGLLYAAVSLSPLPKTVFTLAAGALFGVPLALAVVVSGAMVGALVAFGTARWLGRDTVERWTRRRPRTAIAYARTTDLLERRGLVAVLVLRLVPLVPFTALNYLSGLSTVRLRDFIIGTLVGILPATTAAITIAAYGSRPGSWPFVAGILTLAGLSVAGLVLAAIHRRRSKFAAAA